MFSDYKNYLVQLNTDLKQQGFDLGVNVDTLYKGGLTQDIVRIELFFLLNDMLRVATGDDADLVYIPDKEKTLVAYLKETLRDEYVRDIALQEKSLFAQPDDAGQIDKGITQFDLDAISEFEKIVGFGVPEVEGKPLDLTETSESTETVKDGGILVEFRDYACDVMVLPDKFQPIFQYNFKAYEPDVVVSDEIETPEESYDLPTIDDFIDEDETIEDTEELEEISSVKLEGVGQIVEETEKDLDDSVFDNAAFDNDTSFDFNVEDFGKDVDTKVAQHEEHVRRPHSSRPPRERIPRERENRGRNRDRARHRDRERNRAHPDIHKKIRENFGENSDPFSNELFESDSFSSETPTKQGSNKGDKLADGLVGGVNRIYEMLQGKSDHGSHGRSKK